MCLLKFEKIYNIVPLALKAINTFRPKEGFYTSTNTTTIQGKFKVIRCEKLMKKAVKNNLILTSTFCFLMALIILLPPAIGYGFSFETATKLGNGTTIRTFYSTDDNAYYKVNCKAGDTLDVMVTYNKGLGDSLELYIYDPSYVLFSSHISGVSPIYLSNTITTGGFQYLNISRWAGSNQLSLTINIIGATGDDIPGFGILAAVLGLVMAIGIIAVLFKNRIRLNS